VVNKFKENWLKEDERCPSCNQVTHRVRGVTKQNLKRLIKPKWDINEFTIMFFLVFFILIAFLYKVETQTCRDWIKNMTYAPSEEECKFGCTIQCANKCGKMNFSGWNELNNLSLNLSNINLNVSIK